jgi:aryl-alcohol dehydrogenase-like predicted oxidoreductase
VTGAKNRALLDEVSIVAMELGVTTAQLAIAWLLAQGDDVVPIPGTTQEARLSEKAAAARILWSDADLARLDSVAPRASWSGDRVAFAALRTTRT